MGFVLRLMHLPGVVVAGRHPGAGIAEESAVAGRRAVARPRPQLVPMVWRNSSAWTRTARLASSWTSMASFQSPSWWDRLVCA